MKKNEKATINVIWKMNLSLPRSHLLTICKSFGRPQLDNGDVIYDQPNSFKVFITTLTITVANRGNSKRNCIKSLGWSI